MITIREIQELQRAADAAKAFANSNRPQKQEFTKPLAPNGILNGNQIDINRIAQLVGIQPVITAQIVNVALNSRHPAISEALKELITITKLVMNDHNSIQTAIKTQDDYDAKFSEYTRLTDAEEARYNEVHRDFMFRCRRFDQISLSMLDKLIRDLRDRVQQGSLNKWEEFFLIEVLQIWDNMYNYDSPRGFNYETKTPVLDRLDELIERGYQTDSMFKAINRVPKRHREWIHQRVEFLTKEKYLPELIEEYNIDPKDRRYVDLFAYNGTDPVYDAQHKEIADALYETMLARAKDLARAEIRANFLNKVPDYEEIYELRKQS